MVTGAEEYRTPEEEEEYGDKVAAEYERLLREGEGARMERELREFLAQEGGQKQEAATRRGVGSEWEVRQAEQEARQQAAEDAFSRRRHQAAADAYREAVRKELGSDNAEQTETAQSGADKVRAETEQLIAEETARSQAERSASRKEQLEELKLKVEKEKLRGLRRPKSGPPGKSANIGGVVRQIATLGGPVGINKNTQHLYIPSGVRPSFRPNVKGYDLTGMRSLTGPGSLGRLRSATLPQPMRGNPNLGLRRQGIDLSGLRTGGLDLSRLRVAGDLSKLRTAGAVGNSPIAQYARQSTQTTMSTAAIPVAKPQVERDFAPSRGKNGHGIALRPGERVVKKWQKPVWFMRMSDNQNVVSYDSQLTRLSTGNYAFRAVDDETFEGLYRIVGKNPPKETDTFGPLRIARKSKR